MAYIFMDESGDLGFDFSKSKTSNYFVITFLFSKDRRPLEKIVKKVFLSLSGRIQKHHPGILHCYKESPATRIKLLSRVNDLDCSVMCVYLNKKKVYTRLQDEVHVLYNYVTNILLDRIYTKKLIPTDEGIFLVAAKRETNKFLNENFKTYLQNQILGNHHAILDISVRRLSEDKCLQVCDFLSWSIFRSLEHQDDSYMNIFKNRITEKSPLFP